MSKSLHGRQMNKTTSIYLDLVRFCASMGVFLGHASYARFNGQWLQRLSFLKHDAVIVFFVLSGYVIAYVANTKERSFAEYSISRLARLYSVVFPALLLTFVLDNIGMLFDPVRYSGYAYDHVLVRFMASLAFVNNLHFVSISVFSNGPFWSVSFEFWYYVIFGLFFYLKGMSKMLLLVTVTFLVGIKILLLLPIWLMGVLIFYIDSRQISKEVGWLFFLGSFLLYALFRDFEISNVINLFVASIFNTQFTDKLLWANSFLSDYLLSIIISCNFIGLVVVSEHVPGSLINKMSKPIRFLAGYTFSIYLLHFPLLNFFSSFLSSSLIVMTMTLLCIFFVGTFTEKKKYVFKRWIASLFVRVTTASAGLWLSVNGSKRYDQ